jgi:hypothetical protein
MSKPIFTAQSLLKQCGINDPLQLPIEMIARSNNIII